MQLLYSRNADESMDKAATLKQYRWGIEQSYKLFSLAVYLLIRITEFAELDEKKRSEKHLPSDEDSRFRAILYQNALIQSLLDNEHFQKRMDELGFDELDKGDLLKEIYKKYAKEKEYIAYATSEDPGPEDHKQGLLSLFRFVKKNEIYEEILEDQFFNWSDDKSLIIGAVKKLIKGLPVDNEPVFERFAADEDTTEEFGLNLIKQYFEKEEELLQIIKPNLQNWDAERLAQIDLILLKMALCEMLYFPTIPTKVTLNEYVELSKNYSTDKSKEFINGILDKMLKELTESGKIEKTGRGLRE